MSTTQEAQAAAPTPTAPSKVVDHGARAPGTGVDRAGFLFFGANRRSGTTWLHAMLNCHPEIVMKNEGWFLNDLGCSAEQWLDEPAFRTWADLGSSKGTWAAGMSTDEAVTLVQRSMVEALMRRGAARETWKDTSKFKWIGDKSTTHYCAKIDTLHRLFPDGRFLCMVRDGRDVVVSDFFMRLRDRDFDSFPGKGADAARRSFERYYQGAGAECPFFTQETLGPLLDHWSRSIRGGWRARELYGPGYYEVKYEDLVRDAKLVKGIYDFLGVQSDAGLINWVVDTCRFERFAEGRKPGVADPKSEYRKGIIGDWRNYFTDRDKDQFKRSDAGALLIELGYESSDAW